MLERFTRLSRKQRVALVATGALIVAAIGSGGGEATPAPEAAGTLPPATTTTTVSDATSTAVIPTTTRPIPFPEQEHANLIFAVPVAGASGDPDAEPPSGATQAQVESITDGDTIEVRLPSGTVEPLRLIGINSPERSECFASEAGAVLEWLIPVDSTVWLTEDVSDRDQYERLLRYVWVGGLNVGEEMVRRGAALARQYPPDTRFSDRLSAAQEEAKGPGLGLWAKDACGPSAGYDLELTELEADAPGNDHENLNGEFAVIRNNGEMGVDMTGWVLKDESASHRYAFPSGYVLGAGATVTVYTGCGSDSASRLHWCNGAGAVWNNDGDTAFLLDHHGNVVDDLAWVAPTTTTAASTSSIPKFTGGSNCDPSYPTVCIPPHPPDLDCGDIPHRRFKVLPPDPHAFDGDNDGIGCESG